MRSEKLRNAGTWTEARFWSQVRSSLRRGFRYWKPLQKALMAARRKYVGPNKLADWQYQCNECNEWFLRKYVQVDHKTDCGSLRSPEEIAPFLARLTEENPAAYQVLCKACHQGKTNQARLTRRTMKTSLRNET